MDPPAGDLDQDGRPVTSPVGSGTGAGESGGVRRTGRTASPDRPLRSLGKSTRKVVPRPGSESRWM